MQDHRCQQLLARWEGGRPQDIIVALANSIDPGTRKEDRNGSVSIPGGPPTQLGAQPSQQEQVLARLVVIDGHQHLPVSGDNQALQLVQPLGQAPHTVDVNQAVLWIQGRLESGDAARLVAQHRPVGWLTVEDLAVIVAKAFGDPDRFVGREVMLASDVQSIDDCRAIWREVTGRPPRRFPMPRWLFERFASTDETTMWRWLGANEVDFDTGPTLAIHPEALTVRQWLERKLAPAGPRRQGRTSA